MYLFTSNNKKMLFHFIINFEKKKMNTKQMTYNNITVDY